MGLKNFFCIPQAPCNNIGVRCSNVQTLKDKDGTKMFWGFLDSRKASEAGKEKKQRESTKQPAELSPCPILT